MFFGLQWYWWLAIAAALVVLPLKVRFMKGWSRRRQAQQQNRPERWGEEE